MRNTSELKVLAPSDEMWTEYVSNHPHGNIFQSVYIGKVYEKTKNYETFCLAATNPKGVILAGMNVIIIKESSIIGALSARAIIQGGPLFEDTEEGINAAYVLMDYYDDIARDKVLYTEIRNMWDTSKHSTIFENNSYTFEPHLNYINKIEKDNLKNFSKKRRYGILKAQREGVIVEEVNSDDLIPTVYGFIKETYTNAKLPLVDISFFKALFEMLKPGGFSKAFLAKHENKYIGTIVVLLYKNSIYDLSAGASHHDLHLYPNDILPWYVMEWGFKNGYTTFDFGGAGSPEEEYGVRDFKKQFGGELVNFGRYKKVHSPKKLWLITRLFIAYRYLYLPLIYRIKGIK